MAGKLIIDTIQTENTFLQLNVGATQIATMNTSGIFSSSGAKMLGTDGSIGNSTISGATVSGNLSFDSTGTSGIRLPAANTLAFHTTGAEDMRIDSAGNVGIGTSSPAAKLDIRGSSPELYVAQNGSNNGVALAWDNSNGFANINTIGAAWPIRFLQNGTERMRIDSSGNLLVATTTVRNLGIVSVDFNGNTAGALGLNDTASVNGAVYAGFLSGGTFRGSITNNNNTAVAYNTTSDYRLKENIAPMTGALAKVAQLKPCTYTWKETGSSSQGFIAHELAEVCPDAVTGEKDAVDAEGKPQYQGIDTSFLVATLTAAIQEQQAIISDLKARIEVLEA